MKGPAPVVLQTPKDKNVDVEQKKEYLLTIKNISYKLIIYIEDIYIHFKIKESKNIPLYYYQNKYDYKTIIGKLHLDSRKYINLQNIFRLIDQAYLTNNMQFSLDNNNKINLNINLVTGNKINNYVLVLNKKKLEINEKFEIIFNEINNLKKENNSLLKDYEFEKLQQLVNNLENKIYQKLQKNKKTLELLQKVEKDNEKISNENKKTILLLKKQIKEIEDKIIVLNKNKSKSKNNNNNKKINKENNNHNNKENNNKENENIINEIIENEEYKIEKIYEIHVKHSLLFKINLIGDTLTGKTWIIDSFISYPTASFGTTGMENKFFCIKINNIIIKLCILDSPGMDKYFDAIKMNCNNKDLIMFIYAIDNLESFNAIKNRIKEVKKVCNINTSYILVGNKSDLEEQRQISYEEGQDLANKEKFDLFIEVSAKMTFNIDELFFEATKICYKKSKKKGQNIK